MKKIIKDTAFIFNPITGESEVLSGIHTDPAGCIIPDETYKTQNPVEAFARWTDRVTASLRKEFTPILEKYGFNIYTGEREKGNGI
ncbi:MAG: hypothetical protein IJX77_07825 [Ruminococcus sp.]|nr:hypothetical protein [Ruminococcus sp.]